MIFDVIIQARMDSSRLPGKVLLKVKKKTMLEYLIERVKKVTFINRIIIATTNKESDKKIIKLCNKLNVNHFQGSEKNVLKRIYLAAKKNNSKNIIFITGDCPIIDFRLINKMIPLFKKKSYDYVGNSFIRSFPDGMDVQIFNFKTLEKTFKIAKSNLEKEHVTLAIKKNPKKFKIKNIVAKNSLFWPELGLTLDQKEDFELIKKILIYFGSKKYFFGCVDVINLLKTKKKLWLKINKDVIRKGDT
ncbi:NTP transferase domain-containing protein [Candidatus Pelagibacter sp.]|nr:NTP transferase domain-containing protein [Candidatus Pelagibacter sp.]